MGLKSYVFGVHVVGQIRIDSSLVSAVKVDEAKDDQKDSAEDAIAEENLHRA